jgi:hypothetical protein
MCRATSRAHVLRWVGCRRCPASARTRCAETEHVVCEPRQLQSQQLSGEHLRPVGTPEERMPRSSRLPSPLWVSASVSMQNSAQTQIRRARGRTRSRYRNPTPTVRAFVIGVKLAPHEATSGIQQTQPEERIRLVVSDRGLRTAERDTLPRPRSICPMFGRHRGVRGNEIAQLGRWT